MLIVAALYRSAGSPIILTFPWGASRITVLERGPVAQLGARFNRTEEAGGSNPPRSIQVSLTFLFKKGPIAQLGARLNGIEKAGGSNPPGSTKRAFCGMLFCYLELMPKTIRCRCF